jgi:hypothetical protein
MVPQFSVFVRVVYAYWALPFVPNFVCTIFILGRLLWDRRLLRLHDSNGSYSLFATCIAESGALYSATGILHCIFAWRGDERQIISGAVYLASAVSGQMHLVIVLIPIILHICSTFAKLI